LFKQGDSFLHDWDDHLWFVFAGPDARDQLAISNFTSQKEGCDASCLVGPGEHPWITHDSAVMYPEARLSPSSMLQTAERRQLLRRQPELSRDLLKRIRDGALKSPHTEHGIRSLILNERASGSPI
jgi:hypothetical protein